MAGRSGSVAVMGPPRLPVSGLDTREIVIDPEGLSADQRIGDVCAACTKRWPRPRVAVATTPAGDTVRACEECAPYVVRQIYLDAVHEVLARAARDVERYAPNMLVALISSAPAPYGDGPRRVVETAAVVVARHVRETEDLGGAELLPAAVHRWEQAHAWLNAWASTGPPAAVLREVLDAVVVALPGALHDTVFGDTVPDAPANSSANSSTGGR